MLELTDSARKELEAFFADKEKSPIRIYAAGGCCGGPRLTLAMDEPTDQDITAEKNGFTFCISRDLLAQVQGVTIDLGYMGFMVDSLLPLESPEEGGCSACGGGCGSH
ncbi:MAG: IscA/HesB family protein [Desulfovibrio sp.]|jgi:Fe-S cluster assembly iron-binding protein IscA|nr:IscA/HesB family protein [Desulfovibrio sp.]